MKRKICSLTAAEQLQKHELPIHIYYLDYKIIIILIMHLGIVHIKYQCFGTDCSIILLTMSI